mmetsp:Transcript_25480/g.85872  ORF Transcript_25480/g.85872 Transcript_25480/m.85872 type:complete len:203 (-) Transcript_25480:117-725(-)
MLLPLHVAAAERVGAVRRARHRVGRRPNGRIRRHHPDAPGRPFSDRVARRLALRLLAVGRPWPRLGARLCLLCLRGPGAAPLHLGRGAELHPGVAAAPPAVHQDAVARHTHQPALPLHDRLPRHVQLDVLHRPLVDRQVPRVLVASWPTTSRAALASRPHTRASSSTRLGCWAAPPASSRSPSSRPQAAAGRAAPSWPPPPA